MDQKIIECYDEYTHRPLKRETFIRQLIQRTRGLSAALAILPLLEGNYAAAQITWSDKLCIENVEYLSDWSVMKAYLARPLVTKSILK